MGQTATVQIIKGTDTGRIIPESIIGSNGQKNTNVSIGTVSYTHLTLPTKA